MELAIPLSRKGEPLFRQVYLGLRNAILSGVLPAGIDCRRHATWQSNWGYRGRWCFWPMTSCWPKALQWAGAVREPMSPPGWPGPRLRVRSAWPNFDWRALARRPLRLWKTSILSGANLFPSATILRMDEATSRLFLSRSGGAFWLRHARQAPVRELDYGPKRLGASTCAKPSVLICGGLARWFAIRLKSLSSTARSKRWIWLLECSSNAATAWRSRIRITTARAKFYRAAGAQLLPVPVDRDGLNPARLPEHANMVFVTPSHQFPTGAILPLAAPSCAPRMGQAQEFSYRRE